MPLTLKYRGYSPGIGGGTSVYVATSTLGSVATVINQASTTLSISGIDPTDDTVGDAGSYTFTLTGSLSNRCATSALIGGAVCGGVNSAGNYRMILVAASSTVGSNQFLLTGATPQTWGLDGFETPPSYLP